MILLLSSLLSLSYLTSLRLILLSVFHPITALSHLSFSFTHVKYQYHQQSPPIISDNNKQQTSISTSTSMLLHPTRKAYLVPFHVFSTPRHSNACGEMDLTVVLATASLISVKGEVHPSHPIYTHPLVPFLQIDPGPGPDGWSTIHSFTRRASQMLT